MIREILGKKLGMTQIFDKDANLLASTLVLIKPACVLEKVSLPKGLRAKIGCFEVSKERMSKVKKPQLGYFKKIGIVPYKVIRQVMVDDDSKLELKKEIGVDIFKVGDIVNVRAKSKGRGFQGGMKRYGWHGGPGSHGSTSHRRIGSVGATTYPGRVVKGHHMPGHMGNRYITIQNLKVLKIDKAKEVIFLQGAIPGWRNSVVLIKKMNKS